MKEFFRTTFFRKNKEKKQLKGNTKPMSYNIYGTKTFSEYFTKFNNFHFVFKYKFIVPLILIAKKILNKHLIKESPPGHHNRNLKIFNDAYDEALNKWYKYFIRNTGPKNKRMNEAECEDRIKNDKQLPFLKHMFNSVYFYDTAYREFINILMHEITSHMMEFYGKIEGGKTGHLFHTVDLYETQYFVLEKMITYNTSLSIEPSKSLLEQRE